MDVGKTKLLLIIIIFFGAFGNCFSQELKVESVSQDTLSKYFQKEKVLDINNEPCSLVRIISSLPKVDFSSNRGIEKVEKQEDSYLVWVPKGATIFRIGVPDFPLLEIELPSAKEENLYIIVLKAIYPTKVSYRDTLAPVINIQSKPGKAEIYINGAYQGVTPLSFNIPFDTFEYTIRKKRYLNLSGRTNRKTVADGIVFELKHDPRSRRYFINSSIGINPGFIPLFGITAGSIGGRGLYLSIKASPSRIFRSEPVYECDIDEEISPILWFPSYYYVLEKNYKTVDRSFRFTAGLTQQIFKDSFIYVGFGAAQSAYYVSLAKYKYPDDQYTGNVYGLYTKRSYDGGVAIDIGIIKRTGDHLIINFLSGLGFAASHGLIYRGIDFNLGIGYNY